MSDEAPALGWGHINLNVRDLEASIAFYGKLGFEVFIPSIPYLGLTTEADAAVLPDDCADALGLPEGTRGRACILQLGNTFPKLDLTEWTGLDAREPLANADRGLVRLCLASPDLQADYERLSGDGVEFLSAPKAGKGGLADLALCVDPDGTLIELIQLHLERWASIPPKD